MTRTIVLAAMSDEQAAPTRDRGPVKTYTLTPLTGDIGRQVVEGFRDAISIAREIAESQHTTVKIRNETDQLDWNVAFRVRGSRRGAYTTVEVTR